MSTPSPSLWEYLRMRLRLASVGEAQRVRQSLWLGAPPPLGATTLLAALKGLAALLILAATAALLPPLLRSARVIRSEYARALDKALPASPAGSNVADVGLWNAPDGLPPGSREHRAVVELLFSRETRRTIQNRHDRWQERFGDSTYRTALKPLAVRRATRAYLGSLLSGRSGSPLAWARAISPEDLERYALEAEGEFMGNGGPMGRREREALKSAWSQPPPE